MNSLKLINMGIAFFLEIAMLVAFGMWGFHMKEVVMRWLVGIGLPVVIMIAWGIWMAPNASQRISWPWQPLIAVLLFLLAAVALWASGHKTSSVVMAIVTIINTVGVFLWHQ